MTPISFSFGNWTAAGIWIAAIGVVGLLVRQIVPWIKQSNDADAKLRDLLMQRVTRLEDKLERQERRHGAEQKHSNHKLRNVLAAFDAMLMMLEMTPDRAPEIIALIKDMRAKQQLAEAEELKALYAFYVDEPEVGEAA